MSVLDRLFGFFSSRGREGRSTSDLDVLEDELEDRQIKRRLRAIRDLKGLLEQAVAGRAADSSQEPTEDEVRIVALLASAMSYYLGRIDDSEAAARALAVSKSPAAIDALIAAARDPASQGRNYALAAISNVIDPRVTDFYVDLLISSPAKSDDLRRAVEAFIRRADPRVVEPLLAALAEASVGATAGYLTAAACLRRALVMALANQHDDRVIAGIASAMHDPEPDVREAVIDALASLHSPLTIGPLFQAAEDERIQLRLAAEKALRDLALLPEFREHAKQYYKKYQSTVSGLVYRAGDMWNFEGSRDSHLLNLSRFPQFLLVDMVLASVTDLSTQSDKSTEFAARQILGRMYDSVAIKIMEARMKESGQTRLRREALERALETIKSSKR